MTTFSKKNTIWSYKLLENQREPYEEKLLKNCSPIEVQAKIEFLEKNVSLIQSECEALEMYVIKLHPEILETRDIDVSWMPYKLNIEKHKFVTIVPKVMNSLRKRTMTKTKPSNSLFTVVQRTIAMKKISLKHMISIIGRQIINMNNDFDKYFSEMIEKCRKIETEIECLEIECQRAMCHAENYKSEILEAAFDKKTKTIPASKYQMFIKKQLTKNTVMITEIRIKISNLINERQILKQRALHLRRSQSMVTEADVKLCQLMSIKLDRQSQELSEIQKSISANTKNVYEDFLTKKFKMEKYKKDINLPSLDKQIEHLRNKIKAQKSTQKQTYEDDDEMFQDDTDNVVISDNLVTSYLELISNIEQSDEEIKSLEKRLQRQILTIRLCYSNIKKYLNSKKLNFNHYICKLEDNSIKNNKSQDQLSVEDLKMKGFHQLN